jgi:hypothetical protein
MLLTIYSALMLVFVIVEHVGSIVIELSIFGSLFSPK